MRRWLAVLMSLVIFTQPAWAVTYYVDKETGADSGHTGLSFAQAWKTIARANNSAPANSTILVDTSLTVYDTPIAPVNQGTTWIGDSVTRRLCMVPAVNCEVASGSQNIENTSICGFYIPNTVKVSEQWPYGQADGFQLRKCTVERDFFSNNVTVRVESCSLGTGKNGNHVRIMADAAGKDVNSHVFKNNVVNVRPGSLTEDPGLYLFSFEGANWQLHPMQSANFTGNTITVSAPAGLANGKLVFLRGVQNTLFQSNTFTIRDSTNTGSGATAPQGIVCRDVFSYNRILNNTFNFQTLIAGKGGLGMQVIGVGSNHDAVSNTSGGDTWAFNTFKSNVPFSANQAFGFDYQIGNADSFYQNTVICSTATVDKGFRINNSVGTNYILRNTFVNLGGGGALRLDPPTAECSFWTGTTYVRGNIFYTRSTGTGATDYAAKMFWQSGGSGIESDYNLFSHYVTGGTRSLMGGTCGTSGQLFAVGANSPICATIANECNSVYGSPKFADSTFANFSGALTSGSAAIGGYLGANIGAWDGTPGGSDVTPPAPITDLRVASVGGEDAMLTWTAPGDDGRSGTATLYDIRYSTNPPTESSFSGFTGTDGLVVPAAPGSTEYFAINGLVPETDYYFAIRTTDDASNVSLLSNIVLVRTLPVLQLPNKFGE